MFLTTYLSCITIQSFFRIILIHAFWKKKLKKFENLNKKKKLFIHEEQEAPKGRPEKKGHSIQSSAFPAITERATENSYEERKKNVLEWRKSEKYHSTSQRNDVLDISNEQVKSSYPERACVDDFPNFPSIS